jgi:NADH:ubiquinone oxidoreductase subunit 2 (subunit N)
MKIKMKKILLTILILIIALSTISQVFAVSSENIKEKFSGSTSPEGSDKVINVIGGVLDAVRVATAAIAIIMLSILAVKYMISSPNDRAEIKKGATVYVIGAVVMMSASTLVTVIKEFTLTNIKSSAG